VHHRLLAVELLRVRIPLVQPFRTAKGTTGTKEALLVHVRTDAADGWGECAAPAVPSYTADTIDTCRTALRDYLVPLLVAGAAADRDVPGHTPARAALECALLDAELRAAGVSLATHLGAVRDRVDAGVAIGLCDDGELHALVEHYVAQGYRRIKCKIAPGRDVAVVKTARAAAGDAVALAADANGSYTPAGTDALAALDEYSLQCLEQPLAPDAIVDHATLARAIATPICLDETVTSARVATDAIALGACAAVSVKPARVGGLAEAVRVRDACAAAGVPALAGGLLETGIGRAALVALAALPGFTMTGDLSASERYFGPDGDLTEPFVLDRGQLRVPTGPGLGVEVRTDRLAQCTVAREVAWTGRA
jgi:O-succinylbenzoate synthase